MDFFSVVLRTGGSVLASHGARCCNVCCKERSRWYSVADDAYLCDRCHGSVQPANAVANRHERIRIGPNGGPVKIGRGSSCANKKKKKKRKKKKSVSSLCKKQAAHVQSKLFLTSFESFGNDIESPCIAQSSASSDALQNLEDDVDPPKKAIKLSDLYPMKAEDTELAQEVPIFEPLMPDLASACHGDVMQQILSNAGLEIMSKEEHVTPCSSSIQLHETEEEVNSTIENGSISLDGVSLDYELDMADLCNSNGVERAERSGFRITDLNVWNDDACVGVKNPFKAKGDTLWIDQNQETGHPPTTLNTFLAEGIAIQPTICLRLNYEDVLSAWSDRGSLWMDGERPQTVPIDAGFLEEGSIIHHQVGQVPVVNPMYAAGAAAREARVLRYKEKRQTRLFAKKIRYEVRKLNAERRPRMKGRFVKKADGMGGNLVKGEPHY